MLERRLLGDRIEVGQSGDHVLIEREFGYRQPAVVAQRLDVGDAGSLPVRLEVIGVANDELHRVVAHLGGFPDAVPHRADYAADARNPIPLPRFSYSFSLRTPASIGCAIVLLPGLVV
ncbi:MAG: hypothetical protein WDM84_00190 [Bauldia sp.]